MDAFDLKRVYLNTVPTNLFELRRHPSYRGSRYGDSTVPYLVLFAPFIEDMNPYKIKNQDFMPSFASIVFN